MTQNHVKLPLILLLSDVVVGFTSDSVPRRRIPIRSSRGRVRVRGSRVEVEEDIVVVPVDAPNTSHSEENGSPYQSLTLHEYEHNNGKRRNKFLFEPLGTVQSLAGSVHRVGKRQIAADVEEDDEHNEDRNNSLAQPSVFKELLMSNDDNRQIPEDSDTIFMGPSSSNEPKEKNTKVVLQALASLERDMSMLDNLTGQTSQLSAFEVSLLLGTVLAAAMSPLLPEQIAEVLAPASAAFSAAIGIGAEYIGKVAVADGKEVAAATIMCAAEAEGLLANAERVKAVIPLCVGVGATCVAFSLLLPSVLNVFNVTNIQIITELYLLCPLICVLSAAIASLTLQEVRGFCSRAISVGNRRFARAGIVGRTWLSQTEQIERNSERTRARWKTFAVSVIPAPLIGAIIPGTAISSKAVIVTALAACQSAFFLAQAEHALARGTDAVALKARSAAVSDTYANQAGRNGAILPFTSALAALCAAATGAVVELPLPQNIFIQIGAYSVFPMFSALFSAAASVGKARCEVDAEAAIQAAATLALEYDTTTTKATGEEVDSDVFSNDGDLLLRPFKGVLELIKLTMFSSFKKVKRKAKSPILFEMFNKIVKKIIFKFKRNKQSDVKRSDKSGSGNSNRIALGSTVT